MKKKTQKNSKDGIITINTYSRWFNVALLFLCFLLLLAVRTQQNQNTTGDEPYYLLMTHSLMHDRDLSLANNYENKDFQSFYLGSELGHQGGKETIEPKYAAMEYSVHGNGLPILLLPGYIMAGKTGAVFLMLCLSVFIVYLTWLWTYNLTKHRVIAYITAATLMICYFFNWLSGTIYTDLPIAAITLITLIALDKYYKKPIHEFIIGLALGILIIIHLKAIVFIAPAMLVLCYKQWREERKLPWVAIALVSAFTAYYFITLHQWFGKWNLSEIEGGQSFAANPLNNASAMLFDANRGVLIYNPVLLLLFVGIPVWFKKNRKSLWLVLFTLVPTIAILCMIPNWNGSAAPMGRYIMEFLPAFMPAIGFAIIALSKVWQRWVVFILAALTFLISLDGTIRRFPYIDGSIFMTRPLLFKQVQEHTGLALDRLMPLYSTSAETILLGHKGLFKIAAWYTLLIALFAYGCYLAKKIPKPKASV